MPKSALICIITAIIGSVASADVIVFKEGVSPTAGYTAGAVTVRETIANAGGSAGVQVGTTSTQDLRSLFSFDLSSIPANAVIDSVTLGLTGWFNDTTSQNAEQTLTLYLAGAFTENTVVWNDQPAFSTALSSISVNPHTMAGVQFTLASGSAFVAAAQAAYDSSTALSMLLKAPDAIEAAATRNIWSFVSDDPNSVDFNTVANQPRLTVNYTIVPEAASIALAGIGGVLLLARRRR